MLILKTYDEVIEALDSMTLKKCEEFQKQQVAGIIKEQSISQINYLIFFSWNLKNLM